MKRWWRRHWWHVVAPVAYGAWLLGGGWFYPVLWGLERLCERLGAPPGPRGI